MIYIASPYSHDDAFIREQRFQSVCSFAAKLMRIGHLVFSPIAHTHPIAQYDLPKGWDFWERFDRAFLTRCSLLVVLMLDGWKISRGVAAEIAIAKELGLPIFFVKMEDSHLPFPAPTLP